MSILLQQLYLECFGSFVSFKSLVTFLCKHKILVETFTKSLKSKVLIFVSYVNIKSNTNNS